MAVHAGLEVRIEITLRPAPGLIAADRAVVLREPVRDVARGHG
ncbi:hypothetical protein [Streptosporangium sp. NPDC051022]